MRVFLLLALLGSAWGCENQLIDFVHNVENGIVDVFPDFPENCTAQVGTFVSTHHTQYRSMINDYLRHSLEYMSLSSHFGRDAVHRMGFQKEFRGLSDRRWDRAVEMIKYVTKRGGHMHNMLAVEVPREKVYTMKELPALGRALDDNKHIYKLNSNLHRDSLCLRETSGCGLDADLAHQLQDQMEEEVELSRDLAGKVNLLATLITEGEKDLGLHLFDKMLQ